MPHGGPESLTAVAQYVAEVRSIPLLSKAEEGRLAARAVTGDWNARTALVERHLALVMGIARRYAGRGVPFEDLIQEGNLGLLRAAERFDPTQGARFATYATWWVRQRISQAVFRLGRNIRVPRSILLDLHRLGTISTTQAHQLGRQPTDAELAAAMGRSVARIRFLRSTPDEPISLEGAADGGRAFPTIPGPPPDPTFGDGAEVDELIRTLPARLQEVVRLRFGLQDGHPLTLREVGGRLHISRERVRQLEQRALKRIRRHRVA
jgi:RNA polymerase primary sigma factor